MTPPTPNSAKLMLVEDEPDIALMYQTLLEQAGFQVIVATDGAEAWDILTSKPAPDLLLLDVVLPKKDGFEILRDLRKHATLHALKVVLLTNLAQEVDRKEGAKLGATDYVVKAHIKPHELLEKVKQYLAGPSPVTKT